MERTELRNSLFEKFFENKEGISLKDITTHTLKVREAYKELHNLLEQNMKFYDATSPLEMIKKVAINEKEYLIVKLHLWNYLIIDFETRQVLTKDDIQSTFTEDFFIKNFSEEKVENLLDEEELDDEDLENYNALDIYTFQKYIGNIQELIDLYLNNQEFYNIPTKFHQKYEIGEAWSYLSVYLANNEIQMGFRTEDQYLYETIYLNTDLIPYYMQDTKERISQEKLKEMFDRMGEIIIPKSSIPTELYQYIYKNFITELERKYIDLILKRCLNFEQAKSLMIHCDFKEHIRFAEMVKARANELGIEDVCICITDYDDIHEYLKTTNVEDIKVNPLIDRTAWDEYSKKGAALLFLNSAVPGLMDDIEEEKIQKWIEEREKTNRYYRRNVSKYTFPWCIVALPNERWAKSIFGECEDAYEKLYLNIMKMCMIDRKNPVEEWAKYIEKNNYYKRKLNELNIKKLHFSNALGTDLTIGIPEGNRWFNLDKTDAKGGQMIANMPSYEIFTTPDYRMTNGVVYSSRPLYYNDCCIDEFSLKFENGAVVSCNAKKGQKILEELIFNNLNTRYLGEVALVPCDSPIYKTGLVFNQTLFDENASCHLAIGRGFQTAFNDYEKLSEEELIARGYNVSNMHVDFMIGTDDLNIEAETVDGEKKLIFKNGKFNI